MYISKRNWTVLCGIQLHTGNCNDKVSKTAPPESTTTCERNIQASRGVGCFVHWSGSKLHISPALANLSSCDSGCGTVKADGIQGMARAFILAGAQSVLTTMWQIHDESASIFMKFFYQYLMDEFRSSVALHKASLSVRCFAKNSHFVHWSGYQLTGREIKLNVHMSDKDRAILSKVGITPSFLRFDVVKKLEMAFLKDPGPPTDVQVSSPHKS